MSVIAQPMASEKTLKRCLKLVKKASKERGLKRGVKEIVKAVRKGCKGVCILAGNVDPIDVISHIPVLLEDANIPYIYVTSKEELGLAAFSKRSVSCVLVVEPASDSEAEYASAYSKVIKDVASK